MFQFTDSRIILGLGSVIKRRRYILTSFLIVCANMLYVIFQCFEINNIFDRNLQYRNHNSNMWVQIHDVYFGIRVFSI